MFLAVCALMSEALEGFLGIQAYWPKKSVNFPFKGIRDVFVNI